MLKKFSLSFSLKLLGIICGLWIIEVNSFSQNEKFKALFIYNFTKYIEWPAINGNDFKITILGNDNLVNELNSIASKKKVGQRSINVIAAKSSSEVTDCQIIFISQNNMAELPILAGKAKNNNILIITEKPNSCVQGASLNFVSKNGNLNFEISKTNIENAGMKVSSSLLGMGIVVN